MVDLQLLFRNIGKAFGLTEHHSSRSHKGQVAFLCCKALCIASSISAIASIIVIGIHRSRQTDNPGAVIALLLSITCLSVAGVYIFLDVCHHRIWPQDVQKHHGIEAETSLDCSPAVNSGIVVTKPCVSNSPLTNARTAATMTIPAHGSALTPIQVPTSRPLFRNGIHRGPKIPPPMASDTDQRDGVVARGPLPRSPAGGRICRGQKKASFQDSIATIGQPRPAKCVHRAGEDAAAAVSPAILVLRNDTDRPVDGSLVSDPPRTGLIDGVATSLQNSSGQGIFSVRHDHGRDFSIRRPILPYTPAELPGSSTIDTSSVINKKLSLASLVEINRGVRTVHDHDLSLQFPTGLHVEPLRIQKSRATNPNHRASTKKGARDTEKMDEYLLPATVYSGSTNCESFANALGIYSDHRSICNTEGRSAGAVVIPGVVDASKNVGSTPLEAIHEERHDQSPGSRKSSQTVKIEDLLNSAGKAASMGSPGKSLDGHIVLVEESIGC